MNVLFLYNSDKLNMLLNRALSFIDSELELSTLRFSVCSPSCDSKEQLPIQQVIYLLFLWQASQENQQALQWFYLLKMS